MQTVLDLLNGGGWMMYVILCVSIVGVALFFERSLHLYVKLRLNADGFMQTVLGHVEGRRFRQGIDACKVGSRHPLVAVARAGIMRADRREKEIERAMEKEMLRAMPALQVRVGLLGFLANACTLLGLLGTIFGLMEAFNAVSDATAAQKQDALAGGISTAMYTTAFGIIAAVPLLFFHHLLTERQETVLNEVEGGATSLLVAMTGPVDAPSDDPPA